MGKGNSFPSPGMPALFVLAAALGGLPVFTAPGLMAQTPAPADATLAPEESLPPIRIQIEPPAITESSPMLGVAGPLGVQAAEGKPIFAEFVTEHRQSFTDGNRISRSTSSFIYRDTRGRIRRESQLSMPGLPASVAKVTYVTIVDRAQGCGWVLNPQEMVAHRYRLNAASSSYVARLNALGGGHLLPFDDRLQAAHGSAALAANPASTGDTSSGNTAASDDGGSSTSAAYRFESRHWKAHAFSPHVRLSQDAANPPSAMSALPGSPGVGGQPASGAQQPLASGPPPTGAAQPEETGFASAPAMRIDRPFLSAQKTVRTENLGEEIILGYRAHGTRVVTTLPAGEIGNDQPIEIVSEQWVSPELDLVLRSTHRDPWAGEFTTTVSRIRRGEQPAALFAIPPQYAVVDAETEGEHHILDGRGTHAPGSAPW